jgi:hypothetical protein
MTVWKLQVRAHQVDAALQPRFADLAAMRAAEAFSGER